MSDYKKNAMCIRVNPCHHTVLGHNRLANERSFEWCFAGGPVVAHFYMPTWMFYWNSNNLLVNDGHYLKNKNRYCSISLEP